MKRILFTYVLLCLNLLIIPALLEKANAQNIGYDTNVFACAGQVSYITVSPLGTYKWEVSTDGGTNWNTISDNSIYSNSTSAPLTFTADMSLNGYRYRCSFLDGSTYRDPSSPVILVVSSSAPPKPVFVNPVTTVCQGETILYNVTGGLTSDSVYWGYVNTTNGDYQGNGAGFNDSSMLVHFNKDGLFNVYAYAYNGCGSAGSTTVIVTANPLQPTPAGTAGGGAVCLNIPVLSGVSTVYSDASTCSPISAVVPSGANPVTGTIQSCVTVDNAVQSYAGIPYVQRHYNLEPSTNPSTSTATVTLYFTQDDFDAYNLARGANPALPINSADATGIANLRVTQFHGTGTDPGTYVGGSGEINPDDNNIIWNTSASRWEVTFDITGFSGFFVSGGSLTPLPLTLISFTGQSVAGGNLLQWTTSYEENTRNFEVQRNDGSGFKTLTSIPAATNSHQNLDYSYTDPLPGSTTSSHTYRLKMIDIDGQFTYSKTVELGSPSTGLSIRILPNPFTQPQSLTVSSGQPALAVVTVTDISGKTLWQQPVSLQKGDNTLDVTKTKIAALPQGMYLLSVTTDWQKQTVKFIKK